jgi:hypothetical protein
MFKARTRTLSLDPLSFDMLATGVVAGVVAGLAMILFEMIWMAIAGVGFWIPPRLIGVVAYGIPGFLHGAGPVIVGLLIHFGISILWGVLFAWIGPVESLLAALVGGAAYGLFILAFMTFLILPSTDMLMLRAVVTLLPMWIIAHLLFGATLVLVPLFRRAFARPERPIYADAVAFPKEDDGRTLS